MSGCASISAGSIKASTRICRTPTSNCCRYREALENPPLLVVCDLDRFEIHTNFTNTAKQVYAFDLAGLAEPKNLDVLRKLFTDPEVAHAPASPPRASPSRRPNDSAILADGMRVSAASSRTRRPISS